MRNVMNINTGWQFIQKDVGLPASMPTDYRYTGLR